MHSKCTLTTVVATALALTTAGALAGANEYVFEPIAGEMKKGDDVTVAVRLVHKPSGRPVIDAVIFRQRLDMAPDGMADMESPLTAVPASEPGVYAFKTDLSMAGRYLLSLAAKVQGEPETVVGKIVIKAVK